MSSVHVRNGAGAGWPRWGAALAAAWVGAAIVLAQAQPPESLLQQQRLIDDKLKQERAQLAPLNSFVDFDYGGWIDYYVFHFQDGIQSQRVLQRPSTSVWTRLRLDEGAHELFARMRLSYSYFNPGDQYDRQQDWVGPNFDRAWYLVDVGKALRLTQPGDPIQAQVRIGRQDVLFGTGYALDLPMDAVRVTGKLWDFSVEGLFGRSIGSIPNIDRSPAVDSHSARRFFGVQVKYRGIERHEPFAYALWNDDFTDERPKDAFQNYAYDTQYFGIGSRGQIIERLTYWGEAVLESGHSFGRGQFLNRDYVRAFGLDFGLEYRFAGPMRKRVAFEYMFASGDQDRILSPNSAIGGQGRGNRKDTSFVAFGYRDTGLAAGLTNSNLHVFKLGGSLTPLEQIELFRDFEFGTNGFLYQKHHKTGAISDSTAGEFDGYVGVELDMFINWRLASDLSWTVRWGWFFPGEAFDDRSSRSFFLTGLTWSF